MENSLRWDIQKDPVNRLYTLYLNGEIVKRDVLLNMITDFIGKVEDAI